MLQQQQGDAAEAGSLAKAGMPDAAGKSITGANNTRDAINSMEARNVGNNTNRWDFNSSREDSNSRWGF